MMSPSVIVRMRGSRESIPRHCSVGGKQDKRQDLSIFLRTEAKGDFHFQPLIFILWLYKQDG